MAGAVAVIDLLPRSTSRHEEEGDLRARAVIDAHASGRQCVCVYVCVVCGCVVSLLLGIGGCEAAREAHDTGRWDWGKAFTLRQPWVVHRGGERRVGKQATLVRVLAEHSLGLDAGCLSLRIAPALPR